MLAGCPSLTLAADDWTMHTLEFYLQGRQPREVVQEIEASPLGPRMRRSTFRDATTRRSFIRGYGIIANLPSDESARLLSLGEIVALLEDCLAESAWLRLPGLSVSRLDLV